MIPEGGLLTTWIRPWENALGEWDVCGGQDNSEHWLTPSHGPVLMDGLSRMESLR